MVLDVEIHIFHLRMFSAEGVSEERFNLLQNLSKLFDFVTRWQMMEDP
jgi:hypothetical protein